MLQGSEAIKVFFEQIFSHDNRPTVLQELYKFTRLFIGASVGAGLVGAPVIVIVGFAGFLVLHSYWLVIRISIS